MAEYSPFPSLSSLLLHPQISEQDAFVLRVQIATPSTLGPPVIRGGGWIPTSASPAPGLHFLTR